MAEAVAGASTGEGEAAAFTEAASAEGEDTAQVDLPGVAASAPGRAILGADTAAGHLRRLRARADLMLADPMAAVTATRQPDMGTQARTGLVRSRTQAPDAMALIMRRGRATDLRVRPQPRTGSGIRLAVGRIRLLRPEAGSRMPAGRL